MVYKGVGQLAAAGPGRFGLKNGLVCQCVSLYSPQTRRQARDPWPMLDCPPLSTKGLHQISAILENLIKFMARPTLHRTASSFTNHQRVGQTTHPNLNGRTFTIVLPGLYLLDMQSKIIFLSHLSFGIMYKSLLLEMTTHTIFLQKYYRRSTPVELHKFEDWERGGDIKQMQLTILYM